MIAAAVILQSFLDARGEDSRRPYWSYFMDEAYKFMENVIDHPIAECGESMAFLPDIARQANVEVAFSEEPHVDRHERMYYLREGLIDDFINIAGEMNRLGWVLHIEDAFRSRPMQRGLARQHYLFDKILSRVRWELEGKEPEPDFLFRRITAMIATSPKIGTHMSGSALDVSVFSRSDRSEVDRGAPYQDMSELTPMLSPFLGHDAQQNRKRITEVFQQFGFRAYPYEFWHYSKGDAFDALLQNSKQPAHYGPIDFDPATRSITPIADPVTPLNSLDDIQNLIDNARSPR
jgi:D-alanyl-D-alanine dipeptidase